MNNNVYTEAFERFCEACAQLVENLKEICRKIAEAIVNAFHRFTDFSINLSAMLDAWYIEQYEEKNLGSMRVPYLALYAKKRRVRKKNMNRIRKVVTKEC